MGGAAGAAHLRNDDDDRGDYPWIWPQSLVSFL